MRRAANPAITTQMYRHFATVTVALTALVAFLANGEQPSAAETPVRVAKTATKVRDSSVEAPEQAMAPDPSSSDSDSDEEFGKPTLTPANSSSWFTNPFGPAANPQPAATRVPQTIDGATEDEPQPASAPPPTAAEISAAMAASRLRSGSAGRD